MIVKEKGPVKFLPYQIGLVLCLLKIIFGETNQVIRLLISSMEVDKCMCVFLDTIPGVFRLGCARSSNSMRGGSCATQIKIYMQQNKSTHKNLSGSTTAYIHGVVPRFKVYN